VDSSITSALMIALIGMTLLFLSLIFFYGLLSLLTAVIKDRPAPDRHTREGKSGDGEMKARPEEVLRAAVVAVALARAEAEERPDLTTTSVPGAASAEPAVSPWWSLHHQRQLGVNPSPRRSR
jgi:Na+-transporting methylmalonyl-CoA/oxaloacetate decarboxylase gamma subunit